MKYLIGCTFLFLMLATHFRAQKTSTRNCFDYVSNIDHINAHPDSNIVYGKLAADCFFQESNWNYYMVSLTSLTISYYYNEDYNEAYFWAQKSMQFAREKLSPKIDAYQIAINNTAEFSSLFGDHDEAIRLYKKAAALQEKYPNLATRLPETYHLLGLTYRTMGDYDEAIRYLEQALELRKHIFSEHHETIAGNLLEIANCYKSKKNWMPALEYYNQALNACEQHPSRVTEFVQQMEYACLIGQGEVLIDQGELKQGLESIERAIKIQNDFQVFDDFKAFLLLAKLNSTNSDYEQALSNLHIAHHLVRKENKDLQNSAAVAEVLGTIAESHVASGRRDSSLLMYQKALEMNSFTFQSKAYAQNPDVDDHLVEMISLDLLHSKAKSLVGFWQMEKSDDSLLVDGFKSYVSAAALIERIRQGQQTIASKNQLASKTKLIYLEAIDLAIRLHKITNDEYYLEEAYQFAENSKASLLREELQNRKALLSKYIPDSLIRLEQSLSTQLGFVKNQIRAEEKSLSNIDTSRLSEKKQTLFKLNEEYRNLTAFLLTKYPDYQSLKFELFQVDLPEIQSQLDVENQMLIQYVMGDAHLYVFFISKDEIKVSKVAKAEDISAMTIEIIEIAKSPPISANFQNQYRRFLELSYTLYDSLIQHPAHDILNECEGLIFIPDGILNYLPFELLINKDKLKDHARQNQYYKDLPYLFQSHEISYLYSSSFLKPFDKEASYSRKKYLIAGLAPSFDNYNEQVNSDCFKSGVYNLQCNSNEVEAICQSSSGELYLGRKATKQAFLNVLDNNKIIHLATHACLDRTDYLYDKIYFADSAISSFEIGNLKISADLAVLSACNSGTGTHLKGEGVISLSRQFTAAGCPSTIMSLWTVDDCKATDVLLPFYNCLRKGMTKNKALQMAKSEYLSSADLEYSHPYYWSAFVLSGQTNAIFNRFTYADYFMWTSLTICFAFVIYFAYRKYCLEYKIVDRWSKS